MLSALHVARWTLGGTIAVIAGLAASAEPLAPMPPLARPETIQTEPLRISLAGSEMRASASLASPVVVRSGASVRPEPRPFFTAEARWDGREQGEEWSLAAMRAILSAPRDLREVVPADISTWCPGYERNPPHLRAAFWVGTVSALARYESNFDPRAQGGGGAWQGLLQISPATARHYGCAADSGEELRDGEANLECAIRIMSRTVTRDGVVAAGDRGIAADWGPMSNDSLREQMRDWVRDQSYCEVQTAVMAAVRPPVRPDGVEPGGALVASLRPESRPSIEVPTTLAFLAWE